MSERIDYNSNIHDRIAPLYESRHEEIFNPTEQRRISDQLTFAMGSIACCSGAPRVLDFGAGTGNLTRHLLKLGSAVVACDVSAGCLRELEASSDGTACLELSLLNGRDLSQFADASFDMVAVYSVLHHVPDYLAIIDEFVRVVKPGGVIYIDHEVCPAYWEERPQYRDYCQALDRRRQAERVGFWQHLAGISRRKHWWRYLASALWVRLNRVEDEGDIHTHPDDHIEWEQILARMEGGCRILRQQDYLVCRERAVPAVVWDAWRHRCADMRLTVAQRCREQV